MEKIKRTRRSDDWIIKNNGEIVYPYSEAEKRGIGRREFRNSIDELIGKGLLDITHQGCGGSSRDMTKYYIDNRWEDYGTSLFRPAKNPHKKDGRKGRGWSVYHVKKGNTSITKMLPKKVTSDDNYVTSKKKIKRISSGRFANSKNI
jgi:hypothetical protein